MLPETSGNIMNFKTLTTSILSDGILIYPAHQTNFSVPSTTAVLVPWGQPLTGWLFCFPTSLEAFLLLLPGICFDFGMQGFLGQSWAPISISLGLQWWDSPSYPFHCLVFTKDLQCCWWLRLQPRPWLPSVNNHSLRGIFHPDVTIISRSSLANMKSHKEMSTRTAKEQFHSLTKAPQKLMKAGYWGVNARPKMPQRLEMRMV